MKSLALKFVWFTSFYLITFAVIAQFEIPEFLAFCMMIFGQLLLIFMVYVVLKAHYATIKSFEDWYEYSSAKALE